MVKILLVGHGAVATALLDTARMVAGPLGDARAIEFPAGMGIEELTDRVRSAIDELRADADERVLILTDVAGGSPSRVALTEALADHAEVVTGVNLPMVIEALFAPITMTLQELVPRIVDAGRAGVRDLGAELSGRGVDA
jgi:mannose/fructose/sorbose-specific phosphotransferase system IIA component